MKIDNFKQLGLNPSILKALELKGYKSPSPIQQQAIPAVLEGRDIMAAAQTGTGKTAGFSLPILELLAKGKPARGNQVRSLILTPTRELAAQVAENVEAYGKLLRLKSVVVFGGVKINPQMMKLRSGCDILIATPGRLLDLYNQNALRFHNLEILVLDEADRMLDMGFIRDIKKIISLLPKKRQNLMFSATFSNEIRKLAKGIIHNPVEVSVGAKNAPKKVISQSLYEVDQKRKKDLLYYLVSENDWRQVLVFCRTKHGANRLAKQLAIKGLNTAAIHGNKSQGARTTAIKGFKEGSIDILVATDIAARGIDIDDLDLVINFDLPHVPEDYVHRVGRTGRAGKTGQAISFLDKEQVKELRGIERLIKQVIERKTVAEFAPSVSVAPESFDPRPKKIKRPKKPKVRNVSVSASKGRPRAKKKFRSQRQSSQR